MTVEERYEALMDQLRQDGKTERLYMDRIIGFDYTKVYTEYANAIGAAPDELTDQQKRQAVMNAVLEEA